MANKYIKINDEEIDVETTNTRRVFKADLLKKKERIEEQLAAFEK